ncbi:MULTISPECIES: LysR family transcriptional regulator ArgP [unclassified Vibrio]|uniref:LysR family transcriptional regulator ArgP n=1 Tax=Vibrio sp. HB236076 TaxID=3232307 RepID=A0AB39H9W7_9VIBR|nr:LysR family transcriptional regulator ArgP [Vibrio sp. HB161653]MDP5253933.1 LysR family transcriptional regulator ArgP [Vibrio sp. HB161653]
MSWRGFDYKWLEALDAVITQGGFDTAAQFLCLSQSAVSQRIKQLELWLSQPVVVRTQPPEATAAGQQLLSFYHQVGLLEQDVLPNLIGIEQRQVVSLSLATNADSLATWLMPALQPILSAGKVALNLLVSDESHTLEKLRSGQVAGAISLQSDALSGCIAEYLGKMNYVCVATPTFFEQYFSEGLNAQTVIEAPAVVFDQYDRLHQDFLSYYFHTDRRPLVEHKVASSEAFVKLALAGVAYCLIPKLQIETELATGQLVEIDPERRWQRKLYWHHWHMETRGLKAISVAIKNHSAKVLSQ